MTTNCVLGKNPRIPPFSKLAPSAVCKCLRHRRRSILEYRYKYSSKREQQSCSLNLCNALCYWFFMTPPPRSGTPDISLVPCAKDILSKFKWYIPVVLRSIDAKSLSQVYGRLYFFLICSKWWIGLMMAWMYAEVSHLKIAECVVHDDVLNKYIYWYKF